MSLQQARPETAIADTELRRLVTPERVHRRLYLDPAIFELELERIFGRAWLYVGHASQIPNPGDFFCTFLGREPVVMVRHEDGQVHVLFNRCGHRGAKVVNEACGSAKRFRCLYHGWSFNTDGSLASAPLRDGFPADFNLADPARGMVRLPGVDTYRGFVFARMTAEGPALLDWLGDARFGIDEVADRSPLGEVEVTGGVHRYYFRGNWKLQAENLADQYHAPFSHESSVTPDGYQFSRRPGEKGTRIKILGRDGEAGMETKGMWTFPWGHNAGGALTSDGEQDGPVFATYRRSLEEKHGVARTREILMHQRHSSYFYPNFDIHILAQAIRIIRPIRVDLTEVLLYPMKLKGAPEEMFQDTVRLLNISHSCSSLGQTDDVEAFERAQVGLETRGEDWIVFYRGLGLDAADNERGGLRSPQYSEAGMRGQHESWLKYMVDWQ